MHAGKQILEHHYADLKEAIASGTVDDMKAVGLLDQWLIEGKYTEEEALVLSCDMLAAGMDTVSINDVMQAVSYIRLLLIGQSQANK